MNTICPSTPSKTSALPSAGDPGELLLLDGNTVRALLSRDEALAAVRQAFEHHSAGAGRVFSLVREALGEGAVFGVKSGDIAAQGILGLKAAGFWPANHALGKEAHQATILLLDPATGRPLSLLDGNHITTLRTGAAGGIGIQVLARADCRRVCVFGSGVQAQIQLEFALKVRPSIDAVAYITADGVRAAAFEARFGASVRVRHEVDADLAVSKSDIVITATPSRAALFSDAAVQPGTHINAVGADTRGKRELPAGLLARSRLVVDDTTQARQFGEAQWAPESPMTDIGAILLGQHPFERRPTDITIFDMTGLALQDLVVARLLLDKARGDGSGRRLPWFW